MLGDLAELLRGERAGLVEDGLPGADLADIMQLAAQTDTVESPAVETQALRGVVSSDEL